MTLNPPLAIAIALLAALAVTIVEAVRLWRRVARNAARLRQTQVEINDALAARETPQQTFRVSPVNRHRARRTGQNWRDS